VGGSEAKNGLGSDEICEGSFFIVLLNSPHRETPQKDLSYKDNREKKRLWVLIEFFVKTFRHDFFAKLFCSVFELPSLRNIRNRDKTKTEEKLTSKNFRFFWEKFSTWTFCKNVFVVFLNSPCQ
jgi:hypothetical protein